MGRGEDPDLQVCRKHEEEKSPKSSKKPYNFILAITASLCWAVSGSLLDYEDLCSSSSTPPPPPTPHSGSTHFIHIQLPSSLARRLGRTILTSCWKPPRFPVSKRRHLISLGFFLSVYFFILHLPWQRDTRGEF